MCLAHGTAAQSFHLLVSAMGFNISTYPYYDSGERVLKPWMRDLSEGAGNKLLYDYAEEHEEGILPDVRADDHHGVELNNDDCKDSVALGETSVHDDSMVDSGV